MSDSEEFSSEDDKFSVNIVFVYYVIGTSLFSDLYMIGLLKDNKLIKEVEQEAFEEVNFKIKKKYQIVKKLLVLEKSNMNLNIQHDHKFRKISKFSQRGCLTSKYLIPIKEFYLNNKTKKLIKHILGLKRSLMDESAYQFNTFSDDDEKSFDVYDQITQIEDNNATNEVIDFGSLAYNVEKMEKKTHDGELPPKDDSISRRTIKENFKKQIDSGKLLSTLSDSDFKTPTTKINNLKNYPNPMTKFGKFTEKFSNDTLRDPQISVVLEDMFNRIPLVNGDKDLDKETLEVKENVFRLLSCNFIKWGGFILKNDRVFLMEPLCHAYGDFVKNRKDVYTSKDNRFGYSFKISRICKSDIIDFSL